MEASTLVAILMFATLGIGAAAAYFSKRSTEQRLEDDDAPKSTLAADSDSRGKPADV